MLKYRFCCWEIYNVGVHTIVWEWERDRQTERDSEGGRECVWVCVCVCVCVKLSEKVKFMQSFRSFSVWYSINFLEMELILAKINYFCITRLRLFRCSHVHIHCYTQWYMYLSFSLFHPPYVSLNIYIFMCEWAGRENFLIFSVIKLWYS